MADFDYIQKSYQHCSMLQSFLSRLKFAWTLQVAQAAESNVTPSVTTVTELKPETLNALQLPRVIMIGDEKAGKSSTLERIAGVDCLPRDRDICTRQPIVLKLFFDPAVDVSAPSFKLFIPEIAARPATSTTAAMPSVPAVQILTDINSATVKSKIKERMDLIKTMGIGLIYDSEIIVEIRSNGVPTIELVDLPGLRTSKPQGEPTDLPELTQQCVKKYMECPLTGAVVCVVDAAVGNLVSSKSVLMVQESPEKLKKNTIGVFTKADRAVNYEWYELTDAESSLYQLESCMSGVQTQYQDFQYGFVAMVNRPTGVRAGLERDLNQQAEMENRFFFDHLVLRVDMERNPHPDGPRLNGNIYFKEIVAANGSKQIVMTEKGQQSLGLSALLYQMDTVICRHISRTWLPTKLRDYNGRKKQITEELKRLGLPPAQLTLKALIDHTKRRLDTLFSNEEMENVILPSIKQQLKTLLAVQGAGNDAGGNPPCPQIKDVLVKISVESLVAAALGASLEGGQVCKHVASLVKERVSKCFDDDLTGDIHLQRFSAMRNKLLKKVDSIFETQIAVFNEKAETYAHSHFNFGLGTSYDGDALLNGMTELAIRHLLIPVLYQSGSFQKSYPFLIAAYGNAASTSSTAQMPVEDCADKRIELARQFDNLERAKTKLLELRPIDVEVDIDEVEDGNDDVEDGSSVIKFDRFPPPIGASTSAINISWDAATYTLRYNSGSGYPNAVLNQPLPSDKISKWRVEVTQPGGWIVIGLIGKVNGVFPTSYGGSSCYGWGSSNYVYIAGSNQSSRGGWTAWTNGDAGEFTYDPFSRTLTLRLQRTGVDYSIDNVQLSEAFVHCNVVTPGTVVHFPDRTLFTGIYDSSSPPPTCSWDESTSSHQLITSPGYSYSFAIAGSPLPADRPYKWRIQLVEFNGGYFMFGLIGKLQDIANPFYTDATCYGWFNNTEVYVAGSHQGSRGGWTGLVQGDVGDFTYNPFTLTLTLILQRTGQTFSIDNIQSSQVFIFCVFTAACKVRLQPIQ
eukprot:gene28881-37894_t